jgi:hypothetical protein
VLERSGFHGWIPVWKLPERHNPAVYKHPDEASEGKSAAALLSAFAAALMVEWSCWAHRANPANMANTPYMRTEQKVNTKLQTTSTWCRDMGLSKSPYTAGRVSERGSVGLSAAQHQQQQRRTACLHVCRGVPQNSARTVGEKQNIYEQLSSSSCFCNVHLHPLMFALAISRRPLYTYHI